MIAVFLILFILTIILYIFKPSWIAIMWLISEQLLAPIIVLILGISDFDSTHDFVYSLNHSYSRPFICIILFILIFRNTRIQRDVLKVLLPWIFLATYLLFHSLIHHTDLFGLYGNPISALYSSTPLYMLLWDNATRPNLKHLFVTIIIIYAVQLIWLPLNADGIYAYMGRYEELLKNTEEIGLMPGSFLRSNHLANFVGITYFFVMCEYFLRGNLSFVAFTLTSAMAIPLLVVSGSKAPIIIVMFFLVLFILTYGNRKMKFIFISGVFGIIAAWGTLSSLENDQDGGGLGRITNGISDLAQTQKAGKHSNTTFGLSTRLIDKYYMDGPLLGCGYSSRGEEKAYHLSNFEGLSTLAYLRGDATFAFYLVEYGLIGLMLYLYYYYRIIKFSFRFHSMKVRTIKFMLYIMVFFLLMSITEVGIFEVTYMWYIIFYLFAVSARTVSNNMNAIIK